MKIIDLNGKEIEVTDLGLAIMQADDFRHYQLSGAKNLAYNNSMKAYWEHFYQQLLALQLHSENSNLSTD